LVEIIPPHFARGNDISIHTLDFSPTSFYQVITVAAANLLIASRGGASPQNFEKRALTIFRLEPGPYESAHQLDCSPLFPTAMATELWALSKFFVSKSNKQQTSAAIGRQHDF